MNSAKNVFLILASMCFIIVLGGAIYEHVAVVPQWSAAPPRSLSMFQGEYGLQPQYFWMAIHPVTLLFMIGAVITNWKTTRRKNILIVLVSYVLILAITSVYFVPQLISITGTTFQDTVDEALVKSSAMWETLSLVRLVFIVILSYILLSALTKPTEVVVIPTAPTVPLSYPNDSMGG